MTPQEAERELEQVVRRAERGDRQAVRRLVAALDGPPERQQAVLRGLASLEAPLFRQDLLAYLAGEGWQILPLAPPTVVPPCRRCYAGSSTGRPTGPFGRRQGTPCPVWPMAPPPMQSPRRQRRCTGQWRR